MSDETPAEKPLKAPGPVHHKITGLEIGVITGTVAFFTIIIVCILVSRTRAQRAKVKRALRRAEEGGAGRPEDQPQRLELGQGLQLTPDDERESGQRRCWGAFEVDGKAIIEPAEGIVLGTLPNRQSHREPNHTLEIELDRIDRALRTCLPDSSLNLPTTTHYICATVRLPWLRRRLFQGAIAPAPSRAHARRLLDPKVRVRQIVVVATTRDHLPARPPHRVATAASEAAAAVAAAAGAETATVTAMAETVATPCLQRARRTFGTNRGTAYILFDYETDAEAAIAHMHEAQVDGATINVSIVLPRRKLSPAPPTARRGANIDPRIPFAGPRGGLLQVGAGGNGGNMAGGGGRRRMSPGNRYGPRSDVYRPGSRSPSRSPGGPPPSRGGAGSRYRSHSNASYSSRSRSRSPAAPRRRGGGGGGRHNDHDARRRSASRSSYDSDGNRSRSRSRGRGHR
ncbi:hypothetical protein AK830_g10071 [Neonectria ditissima]|uniref:RRM domain-containing protein n=1 Tax=Neonectria ditissima TaxID=78410 RepID=A0A0P7B7M0_9HYPO|nr:hypothetical protein AK830_g10071 [Neonectria ditissima]